MNPLTLNGLKWTQASSHSLGIDSVRGSMQEKERKIEHTNELCMASGLWRQFDKMECMCFPIQPIAQPCLNSHGETAKMELITSKSLHLTVFIKNKSIW